MEYHCPLCGAMIAEGSAMCSVCKFQTGTHPGLTASPVVYQLVNAVYLAIASSR